MLIRSLGPYRKIGFQRLKSFLLKGNYSLLASFAVNRQRLMLQVKLMHTNGGRFTHPNASL
jgi:hypothetical protein